MTMQPTPAAAPEATPPPVPTPVADTAASAQVTPPAVAPAVETPAGAAAAAPAAPAGTPQPEAASAASLPPEAENYIAQLEQESASYREQADRSVLTGFIQRDAERLVNDFGLTPEAAQKLARERGNAAWQSYQDRRRSEGRLNAALSIGAEYSVDPRQLVTLPTPEAMIARAKEMGAQKGYAARLQALERENSELKKRLAPVQQFANTAAGPDGARPTPDNIDELYLQNPDRWGDTYRRFRQTGRLS